MAILDEQRGKGSEASGSEKNREKRDERANQHEEFIHD